MTIELVAPDLSWMSKMHHPEMIVGDHPVPRPFTLPAGELRSLDGKNAYVVEDDYVVACGGGADVAVRGKQDVPVIPPDDVRVWAAQAFFVTAGLGLVRTMSLDALVRLADLPPPTLSRCPHCRGKLREPGAEVLVGAMAVRSDGIGCPSAPICSVCGGYGRVPHLEDGYDEIKTPLGVIKVDRRALTPIVKHLRGDQVALCLAPSLESLGMDAHLRPYVEIKGKKCVGGDWRIVWPAVEESKKIDTPMQAGCGS